VASSVRLRFRDTSPPSRLEAKFALYWRSFDGPELVREFRFHAERKCRADFAHIESRTLIEIEGGLWIQGRHNRPQGFAADAEKYLEAALAGWRVLRLTELQITAQMIERIVGFIRTAGVKSV
jgi:very-short-patch-repair endonuclease